MQQRFCRPHVQIFSCYVLSFSRQACNIKFILFYSTKTHFPEHLKKGNLKKENADGVPFHEKMVSEKQDAKKGLLVTRRMEFRTVLPTLIYIMTFDTSKTSPGRKTILRRIFLYSSVMVQDLVLQSILIQWLVTVGIMIKMGKIQQAKIMNFELRRVKMESVWSGK